MNPIVVAPVLLPLLGGAALLIARGPAARAAVAVAASLATLLADAVLLARVLAEGPLVAQMGDWPAPYGITLIADGLSAPLLLLTGVTGLLSAIHAAASLRIPPRHGQGVLINHARESLGAPALLQFLVMGVHMSFLTGDLFNLFVAFEVMLIASYGLMLIGGELPQLREGFKYVVINLLASAAFVVAAGMAYGLFGTLNMADIAERVAAHGPDPRVTMVAALLAVVFATKAAAFPLGFWLPAAYPAAPVFASAFFAAMLTKVGVYALIRTFTLMFPDERALTTTLLVLGAASVLIGGLGAVASQRWRPALAFANVASVGYLVAGAFLGTPEGLAAALYYLVGSVLVVFALFVVAGVGERLAGERYRAEGHLARYPWLGVAFLVPALSMAGMPPMPGFIGKFALISALLGEGGPLRIAVAVAFLVGGFLLLYAGMQIWRGFFWGENDAVHVVRTPRPVRGVVGAAVGLVVLLVVFSGPVYDVARGVAAELDGHEAYRAAVLLEPDRLPPGMRPASPDAPAPAGGAHGEAPHGEAPEGAEPEGAPGSEAPGSAPAPEPAPAGAEPAPGEEG